MSDRIPALAPADLPQRKLSFWRMTGPGAIMAGLAIVLPKGARPGPLNIVMVSIAALVYIAFALYTLWGLFT